MAVRPDERQRPPPTKDQHHEQDHPKKLPRCLRGRCRSIRIGGCATIPRFNARRPIGTNLGQTGSAPDVVVPEGEALDLTIETVPMRLAGKPVDVIAVNGSVPGPTLRMREGQVEVINVHDRLRDEATPTARLRTTRASTRSASSPSSCSVSTSPPTRQMDVGMFRTVAVVRSLGDTKGNYSNA